MADLPAAKRVKLSSQRGSLPLYRRKEVVMDNGKILKSSKTWPELEKYLRSKRFSEGDFAKAEVHFPKVFAMNRSPSCKENCPTVTMHIRYLQHSTHSAEKDMIWDGEKATFKGNPKLANLHCVQQRHSTVFRSMTWRREGQSLRQLNITPCNACTFSGHYCSGRCCAVPLSEFTAAENPYVKLARMTCKQNATRLADMQTCNGRECYTIEKSLPGSYVWFGVSEMNGPPSGPVHKSDFLDFWTRESVYGVHSFVVDIHEMIMAYRQQIANGRPVVLRCGGSLLYTHEVCYVVIVTHKGDGVHDNFPPVISPLAADDNSRRCNWSLLLDNNGHCTKRGYPQFMPHHMNVNFWDHVVFAFHLPTGVTLAVPRKNLIGGGPLHTEHRRCVKFRRNISKSGEVCAEEEARYQRHTQDSDMSGISIDELFSSFEDADSFADDALQSSSEAASQSHLTGDVTGPVPSGSQEFDFDMANVSVEEIFSSFEDADSSAEDTLPSSPEAKSHSHLQLTGGVAEAVQSGSHEDVVDMGNISVEELFSSFEDAESSADAALQSSSEAGSCSHLTGDVAEAAQSGSQEDIVDMANVSMEELFSSFEDADDDARFSSPETEPHSHLTRDGIKHTQDATQEPVVDMANISVEELFSSFEESPATESQQHSSSLEGSSPPCQQSLPSHGGAHSLATANTAQRVEPIAHSSPRLTRKRRYHMQHSLRDLECALDNVDSASRHGNMPNNVDNQPDTSREGRCVVL